MAEAFLQLVFENLKSVIESEIGLLWGVEKEMEKLSRTLLTIRAVLEDAEEKQIRDKAVQNWLLELKHAAYDIDDILDECTVEAFRLDSKGQNSTSINRVRNSLLASFNPKNVSFRHKVGKRMKEIRERLDEIAEERNKFDLRVGAVDRRVEAGERRQTGSILTQSQVYGRDADRERIVKCLVKDVTNCDDVSIYPIIGIGGLGKTTLAQLVFNDEKVNEHFEMRIWVCISDDFNVKRVLQSIVQSATKKACDVSDLEPLQKCLRDILNGKRYLLVLDDVWNEDQNKWEELKSVLACGSKGASIIITTRVEMVALIMGTLPLHHLSVLSEDDCWLLFKQRAFGNAAEELPNIVALGKDIVKKCGGVPLAAKALGSLMRFKRQENEWLSVKESELWNLPQDESSILPALRLSYCNLPLELRQCFAYCALFPKDSVIRRDDIINLWMANGFLSYNEKLEPEDIGSEIWNELCSRSFFQEVKEDFQNNTTFKMHDLMHDLAQYVVVGECCNTEAKKSANISKRIRHVSLVADDHVEISGSVPEALYKVESLRTLLLQTQLFYKVSPDYFKFGFLRVFVARGAGISKVPSSIGRLKHLRYLDLSRTYIKMLPKSIGNLWNLQTLNLEMCSYLERLPKQMCRLRNLRHVYMKGCDWVTQMPPKIGQLTSLKRLSLFIVEERRGFRLSELQVLNLGGQLCIKHLERVKNVKDAREANLVGKRNLRDLSLCWGKDGESKLQENAEQVLEALEPPPCTLQRLGIEGYKGIHFPLWMSNQILETVTHIELSNFKNCSQLPQFGKLPSLKTFIIRGMNCVEYIDNESHDEVTRVFPSLEELIIKDMASLKRWSREEGREQFYRLTSLIIDECPEFGWRFNEGFPSLVSKLHTLTSLTVANIKEITCFPNEMLQNLIALQDLKVEECCELECLPEQGLRGLTSLRNLTIGACRKFKSLSEGLQHLTALESLKVWDCPELVDLPEGIKHLNSLRRLYIWRSSKWVVLPEVLQHVCSLEVLEIWSDPHLASLPDWLGNLTSLTSLDISYCPKLTSLPESIQSLTKLRTLFIWRCSYELTRRCEKERGGDWYKICHIPDLHVGPMHANTI